MIYAMAEESGSVKIGSTSSSSTLKSRLIQLQQGNHRVLSIVAIADGDQQREKSLHALFSIERIRGEWFRREGRVEKFVTMHAIDPLTIDSVWPTDAVEVAAFISARRDLMRRRIEKVEAESLTEDNHVLVALVRHGIWQRIHRAPERITSA